MGDGVLMSAFALKAKKVLVRDGISAAGEATMGKFTGNR
jgi:hypothetical protein